MAQPGPATDVTVLVVTWRARELLQKCLAALDAQTLPHHLLVIDNASTDGSADLLVQHAVGRPRVRVRRLPRNEGFAGGVAAGLAVIDTGWVALLNDDAEPAPGWLAALVAAADPAIDVVAVTSRLLLPSGRIDNAGVELRRDGYGADRGLGAPDGPPFHLSDEVFGFSGGAALLQMDAVRSAGGFPAPYFLYYEDTDTSWRLRLAGGRVRYAPDAVVRHAHSASTDQASALFSFHNERNRLLTLTRCAPAGVALRQLGRFGLTTGSLAAKRALRRPLPPAPHFRIRLRLRVLASYARLLPWALRTRRQIGRRAVLSRAEMAGRWLGS